MSTVNNAYRIVHINLKHFVQSAKSSRHFCSNASRNLHAGPAQILAERIQTGDLKVDSHQEKVIAALQNLYDSIQTYTPVKPVSKGLFSWLRQRPDDSTSNVNSRAPKGLYIHGSVGGGKTTLMDLFYDCCISIDKKKRVHFNSFMTDIHARIHDVKEAENLRTLNEVKTKPKPFDPTKPVADMISDKAWLICFDEFQVGNEHISLTSTYYRRTSTNSILVY